jgi:hypothetical protein
VKRNPNRASPELSQLNSTKEVGILEVRIENKMRPAGLEDKIFYQRFVPRDKELPCAVFELHSGAVGHERERRNIQPFFVLPKHTREDKMKLIQTEIVVLHKVRVTRGVIRIGERVRIHKREAPVLQLEPVEENSPVERLLRGILWCGANHALKVPYTVAAANKIHGRAYEHQVPDRNDPARKLKQIIIESETRGMQERCILHIDGNAVDGEPGDQISIEIAKVDPGIKKGIKVGERDRTQTVPEELRLANPCKKEDENKKTQEGVRCYFERLFRHTPSALIRDDLIGLIRIEICGCGAADTSPGSVE